MLITNWRRRMSIWANIAQRMANWGARWSCSPRTTKRALILETCCLRAVKLTEAQAQANAVMAAQPNNPDGHALLSAIAVKRGLRDQALIEIHRALELEPNRAAFHEDLALLQAGDPTKASSVEDELKKSIALDPKSVNDKLLLAAFYITSSRWPEAEQASLDCHRYGIQRTSPHELALPRFM